MKMRKAITFILFFLISIGLNAQCAMCKAVAESNMNGGDSMASGLNNGIVFLMFIPYMLIGSVAYLIYRHRKKQKQTKAA
jgi:hypothetical protein